jgi:hypothetical protein
MGMSETEVVLGFVLLVCMIAGGMSIMHNVFQGGTREDGTHVETPQEAVDNGTSWALVSIVAALVALAMLAITGGAL